MNIKKLVVLLIGILAVAGLWIGITNSSKAPTVVEKKTLPVGALSGPDIPSQYLNVGGVSHEYRSTTLATATTTPCAFQSPSSTSTIVFSSVKVDVSTTTATTWTLAKAATAFATTTPLATFSLSSGVQGSMVSTSTTAIGVDGPTVVAPSTYLVWGVAGIGNLTSNKLLGSCKAEFIVL